MNCKQVLGIDDDEAIREMLGDVLELRGYEVILAEGGQQGVERLNSLPSPPCVILLDMMMPGMNGWQFLDLQRADSRFARIPVIVCSAYSESAKSVHPSAFVQKPIDLNSLVNVVKAFCG